MLDKIALIYFTIYIVYTWAFILYIPGHLCYLIYRLICLNDLFASFGHLHRILLVTIHI